MSYDNLMVRQLVLRAAAGVPTPVARKISSLRFKYPFLKGAIEQISYLLKRGGGRIQTGAGKGLAFASSHGVASYLLGTHEPQLQQTLVDLVRPGHTFYDVGANCGFITIIAARLVGPHGQVISFEPFPQAAAEVRLNINANNFTNVQLQQIALGDEDREATFFTSDKSGWGRLESEHMGRPGECVGEISVPARALDSLTHLPKPDIIKVDIEGGEIEMLRGAMRTISEAKPLLLIELHGTNDHVADVLSQLGYCSTILGTGSSDIRSGALFDIVLAGPPSERDRLRQIAIANKRPLSSLAGKYQ